MFQMKDTDLNNQRLCYTLIFYDEPHLRNLIKLILGFK